MILGRNFPSHSEKKLSPLPWLEKPAPPSLWIAAALVVMTLSFAPYTPSHWAPFRLGPCLLMSLPWHRPLSGMFFLQILTRLVPACHLDLSLNDTSTERLPFTP